MKRFFICIILQLLLLPSFSQDQKLIPQRIFIDINSEINSKFVEDIPDILFTNISKYTIIEKADDIENSDSYINISIIIFDDFSGLQMTISLNQNNRITYSNSFITDPNISDWSGLLNFINETANSLTDYIDFVEPQVIETEYTKQQKKSIEDMIFIDSLINPISLSLGITTLAPKYFEDEILKKPLFPLTFDVTFHTKRNSGIVGSVMFSHNSSVSECLLDNAGLTLPGNISYSYYCLGGGYMVRTLNLVSLEFSIIQYFGFYHIQNLSNQTAPILEAYGSDFRFLAITNLKGTIQFNLNKYFSIGIQMGVDAPWNFLIELDTPYTSLNREFITFSFFTLVFTYRP